MNSKNKVKYNICNVHYAVIARKEDGSVTFGIPVGIPGAVSISLDPKGEPESFYADGVEYYVINNNQGYDGDLEVALIPESFRQDVLLETADSNNVLVENSNSQTGSFALLFEFDGDVRKIRHVMYNCSAARPSISSKTNEEGKEVQTETLTIKSRPLVDGLVKAKTGDSTTDVVYRKWYEKVYLPGTVYEEETEETPDEGGNTNPEPGTGEGGNTDPENGNGGTNEPENPSGGNTNPDVPEGEGGDNTNPETPEGEGGENTEPEGGEGEPTDPDNGEDNPTEPNEPGNGEVTDPDEPEGDEGGTTDPDAPEGGDDGTVDPEDPESGDDPENTDPEGENPEGEDENGESVG